MTCAAQQVNVISVWGENKRLSNEKHENLTQRKGKIKTFKTPQTHYSPRRVILPLQILPAQVGALT